MTVRQLFLAVCALVGIVSAHDDEDLPVTQVILQYRPDFARSLPIQILSSGIILTLVAVLFLHLVFTAQFHFSLAQANYVLQLSAVVTLLILQIVTLRIILSETERESQAWPYMLSYTAVYPDPTQWQFGKRVIWSVLLETTSGLIQITHIQFLTLLYPSKFTVRLIYVCFAPIVFASCTFQFLELHPHHTIKDIASTGAHVCNAATYLLFTFALIIWGCFLNRKRAWGFDGGTAIFGGATLSLTVFSTTLYVLYIATEHLYRWLSGLLSTVVVWQSFFGWWWWVGAGSGSALSALDDNNPSVKQVIMHVGMRDKRKKGGRARQRTADEQPISPDSNAVTVPPAQPGRTWRSLMPGMLVEWFNALKKAHRAAERRQTAEQAGRILEMERGGMIPLSRFNFRVSQRKRKTTRGERPPEDERNHRDDNPAEIDGWVAEERVQASEQERNGDAAPPGSMLWWGPLRRWRLQDTTMYA